MSLVEKLCKELGVEVGEVWLGDDGKNYYINYHGQLCSVEYKDNLEEDEVYRPDDISRVLSEELRTVWEPKEREKYFVPSIGYSSLGNVYDSWDWVEGSKVSEWHKEKGLIFKTKEEAIEMANKMLQLAKERGR